MMFKRCLGCMITLMVVMGATCDLRAAEFQPMGYDAISMGGAGVACTRGSYAPYYNPALLAKPRHNVEISLSPGGGVREVNLVDHMDELSKININDTMNTISNLSFSDLSSLSPNGTVTFANNSNITQLNQNISTIKKDLASLSQKNGLELMPNVALATQIGNWGIGVYIIGEAAAYANVDPNRQSLIVPVTQTVGTTPITYYVKYDETTSTASLSNLAAYQNTSLDYAVKNKTTYVQLMGIAYGEVPVSYAMTIPAVPGTLSVGGSFKFMSAQTYNSKIDIDTKSGDIKSDLTDSKETSSTLGLDLGLLYNPPDLNQLSFGLVGKNLNKPSFATKGGPNIDIDPQVRAGAAYDLGDMLTLALDMDLTTDKTYIPNYDARFVGGGVSFHPASWFSVRGGLMENLKESDEGLIYTAGVGFGLKWFQLDLAGEVSSKKGEYDGATIPRYARVQLALVSKWN